MSEPLFYYRDLPAVGETITLAGDEARHAAGARRLHVGNFLQLFDGRGAVARAELEAIDRRGKNLSARLTERHTEPPPLPSVHLACALPKGDRQAVLLDMATQLGITSFTPLLCERSVVKAGVNAEKRWRRICLEACKQSRRLHLPVIHKALTPAEAGSRAAAANHIVWLAHPTGGGFPSSHHSALASGVTVMVGPEGGFTEEEVAQVTALGGRIVNLGSAVLRIETAAIALLSTVYLHTQS
ncbi:MAG: 16S rRNA (uracil(1498)-N(3))-methyltransferase [Gammaproteobacteria bacterium]|nr:MAG: 16S rRNA (uracil(1498)-N(3))-methyltransferase [Gammaproteobacteria bacterium]